MRLSDNTSDFERIISRFIENDVDTIRFNITRYSHEKYWNDIKLIRDIYNSNNQKVNIMLDIPCPGNKFRSRVHNRLNITAGCIYYFSSKECTDDSIYVPQEIIDAAKIDSTIMIGDGELAFKIIGVTPTCLKVAALNSESLYNGRAVYIENFSNYYYNEYSEEEYNELMRQVQPEYVVLSFAENPEQILSIAERINSSVEHQPIIISKVETSLGAAQIVSLLTVSDAIMIGRGDMAMTSNPANLGNMQDNIITVCCDCQKPVYVATDILNSMLSSYVPRRSEIIDVHHAINMSASGIVLSAALSINENFPHAVSLIKAIANLRKNQ